MAQAGGIFDHRVRRFDERKDQLNSNINTKRNNKLQYSNPRLPDKSKASAN
jgi:hypothetical protein